jgi:glycosyltransferase involved in cell wall biosynthesis
MSRPLRVLTIGHSYVVAVNRSVPREVDCDPEFDVTVGAPRFFHGDLRRIRLEPEPTASGLKVVGLDARWTRWVHLFRYDSLALRDLVRAGRFDVVHVWEEPYVYAGYQIARALEGTASGLCFRTTQNIVKRYPPPFGYFERVVRRRAQGWIMSGDLVLDAMQQRGYPVERSRTIPLATDVRLFRPLDRATRASVLDELGINPPVIGFMGRLTPEKGLDVLMRAIELLPASARWSLVLLGSGPYRERVLRWAARHGWLDRVRVKLARHDEVPRYLGAMDMLAAPSQTTRHWKEQFGRMIVEAFAAGVPVVGSDSGEIPNVVGDAGRTVPEADAAAWARAIQELLEDAALRVLMAKRGLERVSRYSVLAVAEQYKECYRWLADQALR